MNETDKKQIIERYNGRFEKHGLSIETLASGSDERRKLRFDVLNGIGIQENDSILDLGCGFGDLWLYFKNKNQIVQYTGIDINPILVQEAKKRFPNVTFEVKDIQTDHLAQVDFILSTSCFNLTLKNQDNYEFVKDLLNKCYKLARKGVAIDFLTDYVDFKGSKEAFYYSPERVFSIAKTISKRVCLKHDYPLFEFCIYLYPDFQGWGQAKRTE